ncbi:MAG TPA: LysR family transcriptional regulator [Thermoanaerobaculia bacterium]|nr:LysR family transcriptional regulator [Thermoanaerobaculia bacterium]
MESTFKLRLRVLRGESIALGPGKVALLEGIEQTGTIAEAARLLNMSYTRAWNLVRTMNACFRQPLVEAVRGGTNRGHAALTETGRTVLALYHRMEEDGRRAAEPAWQELCRQLAE